jgi:DNA polymerase/3'-5' exonuclease PolX
MTMKLEEAILVAERVQSQLAPHCDRIEIAGSIRRRKADVGDIEIVCIPKRSAAAHRSVHWVLAVIAAGRPMKGDPRTARYVQFTTRAGDGPVINVDVFTASPENWGLIYAIRTGCADYSHHVLACGWVRNGYRSAGGMLSRKGVAVAVPEERDLFRLAGVPFVEPEARSLDTRAVQEVAP